MQNRLLKDEINVNRFFLACEFKPYSCLWSVLDPFAYDIVPAFVYGKLGVINYTPETYSILEINNDDEPLLGYVCTITHPDTILLLDKIKGYNGPEGFNYHIRKLAKIHTDIEETSDAWCYLLSQPVLDSYSEIQQIEFGMWSKDNEQIELLNKIK